MIVLSKKKIIIYVTAFICFLYVFSFQIGDLKKESVETVTLPISEKVIIVDAGHGEPDEGAEAQNGITESDINLKIAKKLQNLLEQSGSTVILTRSDENAIYDANASSIREKKVSDIKNRVKLGNESSADIFVSIHLNKINEEQYSGWQTFYNSKSDNGKNLATQIQNGLNEIMQIDNNRVSKTIENVYIINNVEIPTTIVECGFLSNSDELKKLQQDKYQDRLSWGIYNGIINYFYKNS